MSDTDHDSQPEMAPTDIPKGPQRADGSADHARRYSIRTILPNVVTLLAFVSGLTAIRFGLAGKWDLAMTAILLAGVLDGLDGTVARLLKSTSRFGAELDSLSDIVAFGIAPAIVVYLWTLEGLDRLGWAVATLYAIAMALRLARFNSRLDSEDDKRKRLGYLTGVPAPAGAGLMIAPIMMDQLVGSVDISSMPVVIAAYCLIIAGLMVSALPTLSLKTLVVPGKFFLPFMLLVGVLLAGLFVNAWAVWLFVAVFYLSSMPVVFLNYKRRLRHKAWDAD